MIILLGLIVILIVSFGAASTGRTVSKWVAFKFGDGTTMQSLTINSINGIGLDYDEVELTAFKDAIKGSLPGHPGLTIEIAGPLDTTASTGTHVLLSADAGGVTPRSFDVQIGVRAAWESGAPQFGISASATSGLLCLSYLVDPSGVSYTAKFAMLAGSSAPAWGTEAEVVLA